MSGVLEMLPFSRAQALECFRLCFSCSLGKMPFPSPSFFQNHFQHSKLLLHHPQPPRNHRSSPLKPHTKRNPSIGAESSKLASRFWLRMKPNLTFTIFFEVTMILILFLGSLSLSLHHFLTLEPPLYVLRFL